MDANEKTSRSKILSLVTAVGSGPIPKGHEPMAEESISSINEWFDAELSKLEIRFREYATPLSMKGSLGR
jgi:hypothetical protein